MDVFTALSYLNKISLFAFIITAGFLIYQFYLLRKESSSDPKKQPTITDFNQNTKVELLNYTRLPVSMAPAQAPVMKKEVRMVPIAIGAGLLVLTLGVFLVLNTKKMAPEVSNAVPTPTLIANPTLKISKPPTPTPGKFMAGGLTATPSGTLTTTPTITPTKAPSPSPTVKLTLTVTTTPALSGTGTPSPTEVILTLVSPTVTMTPTLMPSSGAAASGSAAPTAIASLPLTGVVDKSLAFFGVASFLILFSFVF